MILKTVLVLLQAVWGIQQYLPGIFCSRNLTSGREPIAPRKLAGEIWNGLESQKEQNNFSAMPSQL